MKDKIILTDCDGVLLNWEYAFHSWMEFQGHEISDKNAYKATEMYPHLDDVMSLVRAFNASAAIGFLPPLRDAQFYIKLLHEKHNYRFVCVTSMSTDPYAGKLRERNLAKLFGENTFKEVIFLDCGEDKENVLRELSKEYPNHIWIEDKPENAVVGAHLGFESVLIGHGHNRNFNHESVTRLIDWEEIYAFIRSKELYGY